MAARDSRRNQEECASEPGYIIIWQQWLLDTGCSDSRHYVCCVMLWRNKEPCLFVSCSSVPCMNVCIYTYVDRYMCSTCFPLHGQCTRHTPCVRETERESSELSVSVCLVNYKLLRIVVRTGTWSRNYKLWIATNTHIHTILLYIQQSSATSSSNVYYYVSPMITQGADILDSKIGVIKMYTIPRDTNILNVEMNNRNTYVMLSCICKRV